MARLFFFMALLAILLPAPFISAQQIPEDHFNRGYVYAEKGFLKDAIEEYRTVLTFNLPKEMALRSHYNLGILFNKSKQSQNAIHHFKKAMKLNPNAFLIHFHIANTYKAVGDFENALTHFKRALEIDPEFNNVYTLYYNIGYANLKLNKNKEAITQLQKALDLQPSHEGILTLLAQAHFNLGKYDHTEAYLNRLENLGHSQQDFFIKLQNARKMQ